MSGLDGLLACPQCDALWQAREVAQGQRAVCGRCHTVIARPEKGAGMRVIALALATLVLVGAAAFLPFLRVEVGGFGSSASVVETALAFSGPLLRVLALGMLALILAIPALRMALILYVLVPVVFDRPPARQARRAFRWAEAMRVWSMAEIFAIGCAVALVKIADLARVQFGPAFWLFAGLVVLLVLHDRLLCSWSVWKALDPAPRT